MLQNENTFLPVPNQITMEKSKDISFYRRSEPSKGINFLSDISKQLVLSFSVFFWKNESCDSFSIKCNINYFLDDLKEFYSSLRLVFYIIISIILLSGYNISRIIIIYHYNPTFFLIPYTLASLIVWVCIFLP